MSTGHKHMACYHEGFSLSGPLKGIMLIFAKLEAGFTNYTDHGRT